MVDLLTPTLRLTLLVVGAVSLVLSLALARSPRLRSLSALAFLVTISCAVACAADVAVDLWISNRRSGGSDFDESHWLFAGPWGRSASIVALLGCAAVIVLAWVASSRATNPFARATLVALRSGAALCALFLFFQPAIELRQVTREPNRVAIVVDDSQSMNLADTVGGKSRLELARNIVENSSATFESWVGRHRVDFYRFAQDSAQTDASLSSLTGQGHATLIRRALEEVRSRYRGQDLAGVVLISDGVATGEFGSGAQDSAGETEAFLRALDAPVHTLMSATPGLVDLAVAEVFADEFAFVRTVFKVDATIRSSGTGAARIKVTLLGDGRAMRSKWIDLPAGGGDTKISFELTPGKLGRFVYEISVPVQDGEVVESNNRRPFVVRVIRDKVRVLQVAGSPSWDVRGLRGMLKQNPNVDLISFFILRNNENISPVSNSELSLIRFPTRELFVEELPSFDLVILQNFNFGPYGIAPYLENIRSYVEKGGALAVLGGRLAFSSGDYAGTPIEPALPVSLLSPFGPPGSLLDDKPFLPRLSKAGRSHPVTALRHLPSDNIKAWSGLTELEGINRVRGLRPGSIALAVHPSEKMPNGKPAPVVVSGQYGAGRTMAVLTDSLWKWNFASAQLNPSGGAGRTYLKFWENATRWLLDDPDYRYLRIESDKVTYEPGDNPQLEIRLLGRDYEPASGKVLLKIAKGADPSRGKPLTEVKIETDANGRARFLLNGDKNDDEAKKLEPGVHRAHATADVDGYLAESRDVFVIRESSAELDRPAPSSAILEQIAEQTGGSYLGAASSIEPSLPLEEPRIVRVDSRSEVELWSRPWLLFCALLLLGIEWALRQKWGYR